MMIIMDCLHFANYFVPLIYNSELSQSAVRAKQQNTNWIYKIHRCFFFLSPSSSCSSFSFLFSRSTKDWIRFIKSDTLYSQHKQDDVMRRINIVIACSLIHTNSTSGDKWKCEPAVGAVLQFLVHWAVLGFQCYLNAHHEPPV